MARCFLPIHKLSKVCLALISLGAHSCRSQDGLVAFHLQEQWAVHFPDSVTVLGAIPNSANELTVWFGTRVLTRYHHNTVSWVVHLPDSTEVVDVLTADSLGCISAIDARGKRLFNIDSVGRITNSRPVVLRANERLIDGVRRGEATILGVLDTVTRNYRLYEVTKATSRELWGVRTPMSSGADPPFHVSVRGNQIIISETRFPFSLLALDTQSQLATLKIAGVPLPPDSDGPGSMWRALRVIDIGKGALQSHALLSSDKRRLVRFTAGWDRASVTGLDLPFALISSNTASHTVIGARSAGGLELVVYGWEWRSQ